MRKMTAVLPNYNNQAFLARTIKSLVTQSLRGLEIIIIDDCSTDSSQELIRYYARKYKNIRYVAMEHRSGAAHCRNVGNALASSPYIMVCDSGDFNHIDRAKTAYYTFKDKKDIDIFSTVCIETNTLDENIAIHYPRIFNDKEKPSLFHPTVVYRKEVADKIKYREGNLSTDQYEVFFFEAYRAGFKFWHDDRAFVKKIKQSGGYDRDRVNQRIANYKEFGIKV